LMFWSSTTCRIPAPSSSAPIAETSTALLVCTSSRNVAPASRRPAMLPVPGLFCKPILHFPPLRHRGEIRIAMAVVSRLLQTMRGDDASPPLDRLVPLSWRGELLLICGGMLASVMVAGMWWPYWRIADMDFWVVYNAFLLNDRLPQEYFDHPGYFS